ncbi:hypothetical protein [Nonomuraea sp. NPDC003214]
MAVEVVGGPPLVADDAAFLTCAAFDAPGQTLLVAGFAGLVSSAISLSDNSGLSWTERSHHSAWSAQLWTAPVPVGKTGITVSATTVEDWILGGLKVWVVGGTEPNLAAAIGAAGFGSNVDNNATITGYSSTRAGSLGFCVGYETDISSTTKPVSSDVVDGSFSMTEVYGIAGSGLMLRKAAAAADGGLPVTFNLDAPGTSGPLWRWTALEILPPGDTTPPTVPANLRPVQVGGDSFTVAWDPSTDASGVQGYGVYLDGVKVAGP